MQVTEGRCFRRIAKRCFGVEITKKKILQWGMLWEDLPQIIFTAAIEFYYNQDALGAINILVSLVDVLQKSKAICEDDVDEVAEDDEYETIGDEHNLTV
mmetsp:Transcript_21728/g.33162  ORF Transcript_21728/g.33162 Transcript_21728/m.33162 type:complete len:99 (-) Transcript_21728:153-449(-)